MSISQEIIIGMRLYYKVMTAHCLVQIQSFYGETTMTSRGCRPGRWYLEAPDNMDTCRPYRQDPTENRYHNSENRLHDCTGKTLQERKHFIKIMLPRKLNIKKKDLSLLLFSYSYRTFFFF